MPELPSGTVTFLFTDIEGSTKLLRDLGDRYKEALAAHREVVRRAFSEHHGVEVDTQGDAFFAAFARASEAVAAASAIQKGLARGPVRIGSDCTRASRRSPTTATSGWMSTAERASARRGTAGRYCFLSRLGTSLARRCAIWVSIA
jgi:Adenylate and Guanylate cyclase catalytic domain